MKFCPTCQSELPDSARFCLQCGSPQEKAADTGPRPSEWREDPVGYFVGLFSGTLQSRVAEEHSSDMFSYYSERLYQSGFRDTLQRRAEQFAAQADRIQNGRQVLRQVEELVDYFQVIHCVDLNRVFWPESVLKYQGLVWSEVDQFQLVLDVLDFARENETVFTDFLQMPMDKLRNAGRSFLFPAKQERILLICDQSILGSCKEGFALTETALYWKAPLTEPNKVLFREINQVQREKDWITINGRFFNANPSLNIKMMRLLHTIRRMLP